MHARFLAALFVLLSSTPAWADIAPPRDYVETCTLEIQQVPGTQCETCAESATNDTEACPAEYAGTDYSRTCETWGGTNWDEIWCRSTGTVSDEDIEAERSRRVDEATDSGGSSSGCSVASSGRSALAFTLLAFLIGFVRRHRPDIAGDRA